MAQTTTEHRQGAEMEMLNRRFTLMAGALLALATLGGMTDTVFAQSTTQAPSYSVGDAMKQAAPPAMPDSEAKPGETPTPMVVAEPDKPLTLSESEKIFVTSITVSGADENEEEKLTPIVAPYTNKDLSIAEINEAARKVTRFYRDRGYLVARAYIPKQNANEGILTINVQRGSYGAVSVKNQSRIRKRVVQRTFEQMKADSPSVTQGSLERAMMLVKEMPGGAMPNVSMQPGKLPGSTDLVVKMDESHRFQGYLLGDNQGSQFTGRKRFYGGLDVNSPLGMGDKFSFSTMTTEAKGLQNFRATYGFPLNYDGLRLAVSASRTIYTLGGTYAVLEGTGVAKTIEGTLSYPIRRRHNESINFLVNWAYKELRDDLEAVSTHNPRVADVGSVTVQRAKQSTIFGHNTNTTVSSSITLGQLEVVDDTQRSEGDSDGTYSKLDLTLSAETLLARNLIAKTSLVMQKDICGKVLDTSEELFITGSGGVRAYAEGVSGDNGYVLNTDFRYTLPKMKYLRAQQAVSIFFDNGGVRAQENGTHLTDFVLSDVGGSYYASYHSVFVNVQIAQSLGPKHSETDKTRVWVQLGYVF